jgi:glycopeptide antibiotics resistance protein
VSRPAAGTAPTPLRRRQFLAARLIYVGVVLLATLTQLDFSPDLTAAGERLARAFTPSLGWRDAIDGLRNLALFAGLGGVWVVTSLTGRISSEVRKATLVGFALSVSVEGLQVFSPIRTASLVDVTTNTIGALGGAVVIALLFVEVRRARGARSYVGMPTMLLAGSYVLAVGCEALTPLFRSEPLKGIWGGPIERWKTMLGFATPLSWSEIPILDVVLYAPAGFLTVMLLGEWGWKSGRTWRMVAVVGAIGAVLAEFLHGAFGVSIRWEAAATNALAIAGGAWAAWRWLPEITKSLRGSRRARAAIIAYAALLVVWGWRPFLPQLDGSAIAAQFTAGHFIPLQSLSDRADVFSALHVAQQFLLYLPLGCLLAVWPLRFKGRWAHLVPALWLAVIIEAGHFLILDRFVDVTNTLVAWAGLSMGWVVLRRSGYAPYGEALSRG